MEIDERIGRLVDVALMAVPPDEPILSSFVKMVCNGCRRTVTLDIASGEPGTGERRTLDGWVNDRDEFGELDFCPRCADQRPRMIG